MTQLLSHNRYMRPSMSPRLDARRWSRSAVSLHSSRVAFDAFVGRRSTVDGRRSSTMVDMEGVESASEAAPAAAPADAADAAPASSADAKEQPGTSSPDKGADGDDEASRAAAAEAARAAREAADEEVNKAHNVLPRTFVEIVRI